MPDERNKNQIQEHYSLEKKLANKLKQAPQAARGVLYSQLYDELFGKIKHHPQLTQTQDPLARSKQIALELNLIKKFLKPDLIFLEIGSGDCRLAVAVAKYVKKVYAVDVSRVISRDIKLPGNLELIISDGSSIDIASESVNIAYSNQLLEHLHPEDAKEHVKAVYRSLACGGFYVCITPNVLSGPHDISKYFDDIATGFHLREYSVKQLNRLFREAGFKKIIIRVGKSGSVVIPFFAMWIFETIFELCPGKIRRKIKDIIFIRSMLNAKIFAVK